MLGDVSTVSADREFATVAGRSTAPNLPPAQPHPGRMQLRRVLGLGYEITDYRPC